MSGQRLLFVLLLVLIIVVLAKPRLFWRELNRLVGKRSRVIRVTSTVIIGYLIYGIYQYYAHFWGQ